MLKPLDLQTIMPRSVDMQRIQQVDQTRPIADQQEMSRETIKQTQARQAQVQNNEAAENSNRIRDEDKHRGRERRYRRFQNNAKDSEDEAAIDQAVDSKRGRLIDFKA